MMVLIHQKKKKAMMVLLFIYLFIFDENDGAFMNVHFLSVIATDNFNGYFFYHKNSKTLQFSNGSLVFNPEWEGKYKSKTDTKPYNFTYIDMYNKHSTKIVN